MTRANRLAHPIEQLRLGEGGSHPTTMGSSSTQAAAPPASPSSSAQRGLPPARRASFALVKRAHPDAAARVVRFLRTRWHAGTAESAMRRTCDTPPLVGDPGGRCDRRRTRRGARGARERVVRGTSIRTSSTQPIITARRDT